MFRRLSILFALVAISITTVPIPQSRAAVCDATPGALQSIIDGAADGIGITNPKVKLIDAPAEGYTVIDLSDQCFANQGVVEVDTVCGSSVHRQPERRGGCPTPPSSR